MVEAVCPTLGPLPRTVAIESAVQSGDRSPELLDNGGVITRRILQLPNRDEDMGAMLVRHALWRLHEKAGDGTATAAVLLRAIYNQGVRYITAGGNAMRLRSYLEKGLQVILDHLNDMAVHLEGEENLARIAESICYDPPLAKMLGEIFNIIGEYGQLDVRSGRSRELEREYVEGMYWESGPFSRRMLSSANQFRMDLEDAAILISDFNIKDPRPLASVIVEVAKAKIPSLLVITSLVSDATLAVLAAANRDPDKFQVAAVKVPRQTTGDRIAAMQDLAILTGGQAFSTTAGQVLGKVKVEDLGHARRAWVDRSHFGIIGGKGDPRALRKHIADLRTAFENAEEPDTRRKLRERIGKLMGGSATLWVGSITELEIEARKELAKRTADALRGAIMEGVLPGGGVSLLACRPALQNMLEQSTDPDERAAYRILTGALEEPTRTIITNAGYDASEIMAEVKQAGAGYGFDVRSAQVVDIAQAGIFDAANVQKEAVHSAVSSAALALTVDVLIHHKDFEETRRMDARRPTA